MKANKKEVDMIHGPLLGKMIAFTIPVILSGVLQLLFNAADIIVVGRFAGNESLAAVGSTSSLINLLVNLFMGLSVGANVTVAFYFGCDHREKVRDTIHTSITLSLVCGVFLSIFGMLTSHQLLVWMGSPDDVIGLATTYLQIYFLGMPALLTYNFGAAILRAIGNTRTPLYFLMASGIVNVVLNLVLVIGFSMDVAGVAIATVVSEYISAALVLYYLHKQSDVMHFSFKYLGIKTDVLGRIIRIGLPAGLQSVMYTSSNILIQSSVNALGTDTVAAWTAYSKIDSLFWMIVNAFGISITTFVGQNYGAGKMDRVHKGVRTCMGITAGATVLLSVILYNYASICYQLFTTDAQVVVIGEQILHFLVPTYFTYIAIEILSGTLRGIGDSWLPMIICCLGICALRVVWILTAVPLKNDILTIVFSYPLTWTVTSIAFIVYYLFFSHLKIVGRKR